MLRIGIDIGGTFTDFAIWTHGGYGDVRAMKVPSTPPRFATSPMGRWSRTRAGRGWWCTET